MRKSKFTESQIVAILAEGDAGLPVAEVCRKHGISNALYYQWKSKYAGVSVNELKRVRELEAENSRLKKMYAELALENTAIKDVLSKVVTPDAKQAAVAVMVTEHRLSKAKACRLVGLSRTVLYRPKVDRLARDREVIDAINEVIAKRPRWGFWKCFDRIRLDGYRFNHKRVHRVYCEMRLNMKRRTKKRILTRPAQPLVCPVDINETWTLDFMRDTLYDGRPFRTLNVIDEGNREALRIEVGTSISAARVVRVMNELIECYGKPKAIRLDNGAELTAQIFVDWAEANEIQLRFIQPGKPNQNAFIERFNKSYREEVLDANLFNTLREVQAATDEWVMDYNEFRPHESLGRVPPKTFMSRVFKQEISTLEL